ncbi:transmembrane amino acid transporter protein-domain-containing protein [Aspergillus venezuelensis]
MSSEAPKMKPENDDLAQVPSMLGEVQSHPAIAAHDDVFGEMSEGGPNYRDVGWLGTVALMMKTQIGLGVLSIPSAFDTLGLIPGLICLLVIAAITTWSDYMIGVFKLRHREVYSIADAGGLMFGKVGKAFFGSAFVLYWIFVAGSGMLSISIGLNAVSTHAACTAIFVAVAAIVGFVFGSIRTLGKMGFLAWGGLFCILTAILIVTIAVGIQDHPAEAPAGPGPWKSDYKIIGNPSFTEGITAVSSLIFAYAGTPAFFAIVSEMRDPQYYTRSLLCCQSGVTSIYITIGTVVYYFCGSYVASPALGSAGAMVKKVAYGFALPGLIVTTLLVIHLPAKILFIRILRGSKHLSSNSAIHWITWLSCTAGITIIAYIIASAIPVFDGLVSLVGALLGTLMSFQPMGCMWLYDNWKGGAADPSGNGTGKLRRGSKRWIAMVAWCVFVISAGTFCMVAGTYGSVVGVVDSYRASGGSSAWSCADNSNSS